MLILTPELLLGQGRDRACYQHPDDPMLCVKVAIRREKQTRRERRYFKVLQQQGKNTRQLALYKDTVATNLGTGAVFELIRDQNGALALTLRQAIEQQQLDASEVMPMVQRLRDYLFTQAICVRDLSPNNLMVRHTDNGSDLVVIDGVSNPGVNPLNFYWPWLARVYLNKAWQSFERKLNRLLPA